jgi:integrase
MKSPKTFRIYFWLKKTTKNNNGEYPIYARITVNHKRSDLSLQRSINEKYWSVESGRATNKYSNARKLNTYLNSVYSRLIECHSQLYQDNIIITSKSIKDRYLGIDTEIKTIGDLIDFHKKNEYVQLKKGTIKNYGSTIKYLFKFIMHQHKVKDVYLNSIDYGFVSAFERFLGYCEPLNIKQPLSNNGRMKHMERFKKIINIGLKYGFVKSNPFAFYKMKYEEFDNAYLNAEELKKIESIPLKESYLQTVRNIFVFACYTGLSYIEVKNLKTHDIIKGVDGEDWIDVRRKKTNTPVKVPLLAKAKEIISRYEEYPSELNNYYLLPVYSNQKVNSYLKEIGSKIGIKKKLTFHVARHTFATTLTLLNDVPLETVSKLLGHTKISTTQRYARVVEQKISKDIQKLKSKLQEQSNSKKLYKETDFKHLKVVN